MLPLEDLFNDVLGKAQRGLGLDDDTLAAKAGVSAAQVQAAMEGEDQSQLLALASALGLHGPSLVTMAEGGWRPAPQELVGLKQFNTDFGDMTVNAYVIYDAATREAIAFDTGATAAPMVDFIKAKGLTLTHIFITHTHADHIADIPGLRALNPAAPVLSNKAEPAPEGSTFDTGTTWQVGALSVESRLTWGHCPGGTSFVVRGLAKPIVVVGDALFASSMGGCKISYEAGLGTNRSELFTLSDDTVVCPGHGPLTTIGEEKAHNPFFPEYKA